MNAIYATQHRALLLASPPTDTVRPIAEPVYQALIEISVSPEEFPLLRRLVFAHDKFNVRLMQVRTRCSGRMLDATLQLPAGRIDTLLHDMMCHMNEAQIGSVCKFKGAHHD